MTGRKQAIEWTEVIVTNDKCICKHCEVEVSKKIERIRVHLQKCKQRPAEQTKPISTIFCSTSDEDDIINLEDNKW